MEKEPKGITKEQALSAYNTIKKYCKQQHKCDNCLFVVCESYPEYICLMELSEIPSAWQNLDLMGVL